MKKKQQYNQLKASLAIIKASLKSTAKSPSSIIFTIAFPLIFIFAFKFISADQEFTIPIYIENEIPDVLSKALKNSNSIKIISKEQIKPHEDILQNNNIQAILSFDETESIFTITSHKENTNNLEPLHWIIENTYYKDAFKGENELLIKDVSSSSILFKQIDYILPGQLGFSLLAASIFGTAFVFFNLRNDLVLKRFFASPVRKHNILLAEGISRMLFQLLGAILIIAIGYYFLDFHLNKGILTLIQMLFIAAISLIAFMSFGFIISGLANNSAVIPPISNILVLPQFVLADTFFSIDVLPNWLQWISKALPLTHVNHALRATAFHGASIWEIKVELLIIIIWGIVGYTIAAKTFKWE